MMIKVDRKVLRGNVPDICKFWRTNKDSSNTADVFVPQFGSAERWSLADFREISDAGTD